MRTPSIVTVNGRKVISAPDDVTIPHELVAEAHVVIRTFQDGTHKVVKSRD